MSTFIDVHVLQTVPPSNVNRDDTGSPKTAIYGGVRRARVSSQAWKRATRLAFADLLPADRLGVRTLRVVRLVADEIARQDPTRDEGEAVELATAVLTATGLKIEKPRARKAKEGEEPADFETAGRSQFLVFLGRSQVEQLARAALDAAARGEKVTKGSAQEAMGSGHAVDVSMFGRMVADDKALNVDAAVQVAHALSVHAVDAEFDYFTAVDDENEDDAGAGMIGTVEFNSSTLYRYATVNVSRLQENLGSPEVTTQAVQAFVRAFVMSMPTGKQNTFANRTVPDAVVVMERTGQPVNLVGAFETAVTATADTSRLSAASEALFRYSADVDSAFGTTPTSTFVVAVGDSTRSLGELGTTGSFDELVEHVGARASAAVGHAAGDR